MGTVRPDLASFLGRGVPPPDGAEHRSLAASTRYERLATGSGTGDMLVWNTQDWGVHARLLGHRENVIAMAFGPDGYTLATGGVDHKIRLWDVREGRLNRTLTGHSWWVTGLAFGPDGSVLASCAQDGMVKLWPVRDPLTR